MAAEQPTAEVLLPREIDFERMRPLSQASTLHDVVVTHFSADANRPLRGVHPGSLYQELAFKGEQFEAGDSVVLSMVNFAFAAATEDKTELCRVEGSLMVVYGLGPDKDGKPFDPERVEEFAEVNGMYHAWPYIRELVTTSAARVGLGGVVLPIWTPPRNFPAKGEFTVLRFTPTVTSEAGEAETPKKARGRGGRSKRLAG